MGEHCSDLRNLLVSTEGLELNYELYVDENEPIDIDSPVTMTEFDPDGPSKKPPGMRYILGIEQLRDAIDAAELALGRRASVLERFRAVVHFIDHDAFADVDTLLGKSSPLN